ncbi:MAG: DEAD/DEAH box helicase, partial [Mycoplasmataceae bacterium]|nr:DEAD/DEAH box helicase [Mycoplasmataceae bacterium]
MKFIELKISSKILEGIKKVGYDEMTDIQAGIIPLALEKKDVIGQAPTGTGKTCAFVVPSLQELDSTSGDIQTLVMCPTRELALQITDEFRKIGQFLPGLKVLTIYGGQDIKKQLKGLKEHPQIIIGTPGRLLDHIERRSINLTKVKSIVLDEADEMLDMGFIRDINRILDKTNKTHQTLLLSATMEREILEISRKYQKDPSFFKAT